MEPTVLLKPPKIDSAVWRPEVPLIVIEKCLADPYTASGRKLDPAKLIVTWLAVRWLMAAAPGRHHPTRQIAERVGAHMTSVTDWLEALIRLGLLIKAKEIKPSRNLRKSGPQLEVTIDLNELERQSQQIALTVLLRLGSSDAGASAPPAGQLALDLSSDRLSDQHGGGGVMEEESRARANRYPACASPEDAWPLPAHPFDLWLAASDAPLPETHLRALAAEHDGPTGGHGLYWVGRAILASSLKEKIKYVARVRQTLKTYTRRGYGADLYDEESARESAHGERRDRADRAAPRSAAAGRPVRPHAGPAPERVESIPVDLDQPF